MKAKLPGIALILISGLLLAANTRAEEIYVWNPKNKADPSEMGDSGTWNHAGKYWWDGSENVSGGQANSVDNPAFGNTTMSDATLIFRNSGTITKQFTSAFESNATLSHTMKFEAGSTYTFQAINVTTGSQPKIDSGFSTLSFDVAGTASVTFMGSDNRTLSITSGNNSSTSSGLVFKGGGTVTFGNNAVIRNTSRNNRLAIREGSTLNFNSGSYYVGEGATSVDAAPLTTTRLTRIAIEEGTLNVDGGTLLTGYRGASNATNTVYGIMIGSGSTQGTLNLKSGTIKAIGDHRANGTTYAGITFGGTSLSSGGVFNMTGGELITTNIRAHADTYGILNLDGGTIKVSTETTMDDTTENSSETFQNRLDRFINNFRNTDVSHVALGANGTVIDTSEIDTTRTNGVASITVVMRDMAGVNGTFTKTGVNSLRLTGNNKYTGATNVNRGRLINEGTIIGKTNVAEGAILAGNGTFADIEFAGEVGTLEARAGLKAGAVSFGSTLNISLDLSSINDPAEVLMSFDSLTAAGSAVYITLTGVDTDVGGYSLLRIGSTNLGGSDFNILGNEGLSWNYDAVSGLLSIGVIPEPGTYAFIITLGTIIFLIRKRRK